jgi:hypothetical protein
MNTCYDAPSSMYNNLVLGPVTVTASYATGINHFGPIPATSTVADALLKWETFTPYMYRNFDTNPYCFPAYTPTLPQIFYYNLGTSAPSYTF